MKQTITAQVVMLPQDKEGWNKGELVIDIYGLCISEHESDLSSPKWKAQHIYFLDNERGWRQRLKDKNWFIFFPTDGAAELHQFHSDSGYGIKTYTQYNKEDGSSLIVSGTKCSGAIVASTDPALGLPAIPTAWIRDEYVPSNGSIKEVKLKVESKYDTTTGMFARFGLVFDDNGCVVIVDEPKVNGWSVKELAETAVATLEKEFEAIDNKSIETLFPKEQCGDLSVDQELEDAANNWIDLHYNKGVEYSKSKRGAANPKSGFIAGAEWQKEQSAKHAIEFAEWLDIATKQSENRYFIERTEGYTYLNLYKLWLKTKNI